MSCILELSLFPMDKGESVGPFVAVAVEIIRNSGLPHSTGAMGTCIEGEWEEVMAVAGECFRMLSTESNRVYMTMKVDWRKNRTSGLQEKLNTLESELKKRK